MSDFFPYRLYDGATRPDAISGLNPTFRTALERLYGAAPDPVQSELGLTSGYRSIERQRQLWEASDKSGHMVAAPGRSRHNFGQAADLWGFGLGGRRLVSDQTYDWVHQNAGQFGLGFPMNYEPWHIQLGYGPRQGPANPTPAANTASFEQQPFDIFGGRVPASGLSDTARAIGMSGMQQPPMTPERFMMGMISGENPLRQMVMNKVLGLFL